MSEANDNVKQEAPRATEVRDVVQEAVQEFLRRKNEESEPAYRAELNEERRRREQLEGQMRDLLTKMRESEKEVARTRMTTAVKEELQRQGVSKIDLAFRVMRDDVRQTESGEYVARGRDGDQPLRDFVKRFVDENPEFLPPRIAGGSGTSGGSNETVGARFDLDAIRPGMNEQERRELRKAIAELASQTFKS